MRVLTIPVSDITQYPILSPYFIPVVVGKNMIWLCMKLGYPNIWCLIMILLHPYDNGRNWGPAISHGYANWHPWAAASSWGSSCWNLPATGRGRRTETPGGQKIVGWTSVDPNWGHQRNPWGIYSLIYIYILILIDNCLVGGWKQPEKSESQWEGLSHIMENRKMFQTNNQYIVTICEINRTWRSKSLLWAWTWTLLNV